MLLRCVCLGLHSWGGWSVAWSTILKLLSKGSSGESYHELGVGGQKEVPVEPGGSLKLPHCTHIIFGRAINQPTNLQDHLKAVIFDGPEVPAKKENTVPRTLNHLLPLEFVVTFPTAPLDGSL